MANYNVKDFIQNILINNIQRMIDSKCIYLSFGPITQGIEFLGAVLEGKSEEDARGNGSEFLTERKSRYRFTKGLEYLDEVAGVDKYSRYMTRDSYNLYQHLRCGYAHLLCPTGNIFVSTDAECVEDKNVHMEKNTKGQLIVSCESFFADFKVACESVIEKINKGEIAHTKPYADFWQIIDYSEE